MTPIIHGRIIPETASSALVRRELRILIDPKTATWTALEDLIAIDVLRQYLRSLPHLPCQIVLLAPAKRGDEFTAEYQMLSLVRAEILAYGSVVTPGVSEALGRHVPLVHRPVNSMPTLADVTWGAWGHESDVTDREVDGPSPRS